MKTLPKAPAPSSLSVRMYSLQKCCRGHYAAGKNALTPYLHLLLLNQVKVCIILPAGGASENEKISRTQSEDVVVAEKKAAIAPADQ